MRKRKIVTEMTIAFSTIAIFVPIFLTLVLARINVHSLRISAKEYAVSVADNISQGIGKKMDNTIIILRDIIDIFNDHRLTVEEKINLVTLKIKSSELIEYVAIYNSDGKFIDILSSEKVDVENEIPLDIRRNLGKDSVYKELRISKRDSMPIINTIIPWYYDSKLMGYLSAGISLNWLTQYLRKVSLRRFGLKDLIYIVDNNGYIIGHSDINVVKSRTNMAGKGAFENLDIKNLFFTEMVTSHDYVDYKGRKVLGCVVSIPTLGWGIVVNQPHSLVYATIRRIYLFSSLIGGACLVFALMLGIMLSRYISKPIEKLTEGVKMVAKANFEHPVFVKTKNEIGELAHNFNVMIAKLKEYRKKIEEETKIRDYLQRYLPPHLVSELVESGQTSLSIGNLRKVATIAFIDISEFTSITEKLSPELTVSLLNRFFSIATEIIFKYNGTIDKFIGDCIMAIFGVPQDEPHFQEKAILASIEIVKYLNLQKDAFIKEFGHKISVKVGIATGEVIVGDIGSNMRLDYTAIGNAVNLASRLEGIAKPNEILIDENTKRNISEKIQVDYKGETKVKGIEKTIKVYKVVV